MIVVLKQMIVMAQFGACSGSLLLVPATIVSLPSFISEKISKQLYIGDFPMFVEARRYSRKVPTNTTRLTVRHTVGVLPNISLRIEWTSQR